MTKKKYLQNMFVKINFAPNSVPKSLHIPYLSIIIILRDHFAFRQVDFKSIFIIPVPNKFSNHQQILMKS